MYTIKRHLMSFLIIGSFAISAFFITNVGATNSTSQNEIAGISIGFGGGYYGGHGGYYGHRGYYGRGPYYRHHYGYGPFWRYGARPYWRGYYGPRYRPYYYNPYYYYYGRPGGIYFRWRR